MIAKELKELLIKDLCARLPYKVMAKYYDPEDERETWDEVEGVESSGFVEIGQYSLPIESIKPYLFPLSSMTEEQSKELNEIDPDFYSLICGYGAIFVNINVRGYDWLNKNHFDYRCLIEKSLALDATGLNIY